MFHVNIPSFLDDRARLGQYLGPAIIVGSMLTAKILTQNRQYVCRSTLLLLNNEECNSVTHKETSTQFEQDMEAKLGPAAQTTDFPKEDPTPEYDTHLVFDPIDPDHGDLEVIPEIGDNYIGASINIPRGGVMMKGIVTAKKRDAEGNPVGTPTPSLTHRLILLNLMTTTQPNLPQTKFQYLCMHNAT